MLIPERGSERPLEHVYSARAHCTVQAVSSIKMTVCEPYMHHLSPRTQPKNVSSVTVSPNTVQNLVTTGLEGLKVLPLFKPPTATAPFPSSAGSTAPRRIVQMLKI
jgi:hypothetical protein